MSAEVINHLQSFRQGIVSTRTINDFLGENGPKPLKVYDHDTQNYLYETTIDWDMLTAIKGLVFGLYLEMRTDGAQTIANEVLLQEGMPQYIKGRQREYLDKVDTKFNLK